MNLYPPLSLLIFCPSISSAATPANFLAREHREVGAFVTT
jgi:hypothetical protein